jgi:hypothetical protein
MSQTVAVVVFCFELCDGEKKKGKKEGSSSLLRTAITMDPSVQHVALYYFYFIVLKFPSSSSSSSSKSLFHFNFIFPFGLSVFCFLFFW